jgi:hypothetical protein
MTGGWERGDAHAQVWDISVAAPDVVKISEETIATDTTSYSITLPSNHTYKMLQIIAVLYINSTQEDALRVRFNDDAGNNYSTSQCMPRSSQCAWAFGTNVPGIHAIHWMGTGLKYITAIMFITLSPGGYRQVWECNQDFPNEGNITSGCWNNTTSVVTKITLSPIYTSTIKAGSRFIVYAYK